MPSKLKSFVKVSSRNIINTWNHIKVYLLEENVFLGKKVVIGGGVIIKTTDGGKITIEDNVSIEGQCYIYAQGAEIHIGQRGFVGYGTQIVAKQAIQIGDDVLISAYSVIRDANHGISKEQTINTQRHEVEMITIGNVVWLGAHAVVTAGCDIGEGAVVGANAVVTKDVESYTVVGGVPARFIKHRAV